MRCMEESDDAIRRAVLSGDKDASTTVYVLMRIEQGEIAHVRVSRMGCVLNAGGVRFTWLSPVQPEESVAYLRTLAESAAGVQGRLQG